MKKFVILAFLVFGLFAILATQPVLAKKILANKIYAISSHNLNIDNTSAKSALNLYSIDEYKITKDIEVEEHSLLVFNVSEKVSAKRGKRNDI